MINVKYKKEYAAIRMVNIYLACFLALYISFFITDCAHAGLFFDKLGGTMVAAGDIAEGDYNNFVKEYLKWEAPPTIFAFDSKGGNVVEAMAIGNFIRDSRIPVHVSGKCYSACALIYLAAATREATGEIGLHRAYYEKSYFSGLSSYKAESEYKILENITSKYLTSIGIDNKLIEIINATPSDKIIMYRGKSETSEHLKEESNFIEEWKIAKCGSVNDSAKISYCTQHWLRHIMLNSKYIDGWWDRFLKDQDGEFKNKMPAICQPIMKDVQILTTKVIKDTTLLTIIDESSKPVIDRYKCISKAENDEVWSFFNAIKSSDDIKHYYLRPALDVLLKGYDNKKKITTDKSTKLKPNTNQQKTQKVKKSGK